MSDRVRREALATKLRPPLEQDAEIIARLSALPEDRILDYFWLMQHKDALRLPLLLQLCHVKVARPADWDIRAIRREHQAAPKRQWIAGPLKCFGCLNLHRLFYHHVIEVQHGGSNQPRNLVPLCFGCHKYLHPWLEEQPAKATGRRGFESVRDIMPRVIDVVTKAKETA